MQIGKHDLDQKIFIVAEIGNNHEGKIDVARRMLEAAADAGVDAVKFQTIRTRNFITNADPARFQRLQGFELTDDQFRELEALARARGVGFMSTPFDLGSARFLEPLVDAFKIASGDNDFFPLIGQVCESRKPLIVSTGLADLAHLRKVKAFVESRRKKDPQLAFLHCVCAYPAPPAEANLAAIPFLASQLGVPIGYSDHTMGPEACLAAAALGARILEKHFTLDKHHSDFRDHQLSADPPEMKAIVEGVRKIEQLMGKPIKEVQASESGNLKLARRSIVAGADLPAGHKVRVEDLTWLRPGGGMVPGSEALLVGKRLRRAVTFGEALATGDVE
jgi:N,N'-diacetyllegionaminate synthase